MKRTIFLLLGAVLAAQAAGDETCPFNVPVVTVAPHVSGKYNWSAPIRPLGDPCITRIIVERRNESTWYAGGPKGVYVSRDGGKSWSKRLSGNVKTMRMTREGDNQIPFFYAVLGKELHLSRDHGRSFQRVHTYPHAITSLYVVGTTLFAGAHPDLGETSGIYISDLIGRNMRFQELAATKDRPLIVWDLAHDPKSNTLYASTEMGANKPKENYHPPFFRSTDGGTTWKDVSGKPGADGKWNGINRHVLEIAIRNDGFVYAMGEGTGVYGSPDKGESWLGPIDSPGLGTAMHVDKNRQTRVYLGRTKFGTLTGGMFVSDDGGRSAKAIGLDNVSVADVYMNGEGTRLYVAGYASGIYTSSVR